MNYIYHITAGLVYSTIVRCLWNQEGIDKHQALPRPGLHTIQRSTRKGIQLTPVKLDINQNGGRGLEEIEESIRRDRV